MQYPTIDIIKTGKNIKDICEQKKITVKRIQNYMHLACPQTIYRWFCGKALPTVDNLFALSKLLEIPMEELIIQTSTDLSFLSMDIQYRPDRISFLKRLLWVRIML